MDELILKGQPKVMNIPGFLSNIQAALDDKENEYVIIDFSFDSPVSRGSILYRLNFTSPTNFVAISLRPPVETLIDWQEKRQKTVIEMTREQIISIVKVYCGFQAPDKHEFSLLGFNNIKTLTLDPSSEESCQQIYNKIFDSKGKIK
jgi:hypothetical protein